MLYIGKIRAVALNSKEVNLTPYSCSTTEDEHILYDSSKGKETSIWKILE